MRMQDDIGGVLVTFGREDKEKSVVVPEGFVLMTTIFVAPLFILLFPFLPCKTCLRFMLNEERITMRPIWFVTYRYYRIWRMGRFKRSNRK